MRKTEGAARWPAQFPRESTELYTGVQANFPEAAALK